MNERRIFLTKKDVEELGGIELTNNSTDVIRYLYIPLNNSTMLNAYFYFVDQNGDYITESVSSGGNTNITVNQDSYLWIMQSAVNDVVLIRSYTYNGLSGKLHQSSCIYVPIAGINSGHWNSNYSERIAKIPNNIVVYLNDSILYIKIDVNKLSVGNTSSTTIYANNYYLKLKLNGSVTGSNIYYEPYSA